MDALCAVGAVKMCHERSHRPRGFEGVFFTLFNVEPILLRSLNASSQLTARLRYRCQGSVGSLFADLWSQGPLLFPTAKFTMASMWMATTLTALVAGTHAVSPVLFWASFPVLPNETVVIAGSGFATANGVCTPSPNFLILPTKQKIVSCVWCHGAAPHDLALLRIDLPMRVGNGAHAYKAA